jgi:hypothetical protein
MSLHIRTLVAMAGLGLISAAVLGCSDDSSDEPASPTGETPATATATLTASGGTGAPGSGDGGGVPTTGTGANTGAGGPTTGTGASGPAPPGFPASDEPPATTASANGQTVETGLGTYCWTLMCVDKIGVPTKGTLTVSSGDTVSIAVPAAAPPLREAAANTFAAVDAQKLDDGSEIWPYPGTTGDTQEYAISGNEIDVMLDLPPGRYVLAVSMYFEAGDAVYGVLLEVQ